MVLGAVDWQGLSLADVARPCMRSVRLNHCSPA